MDQDSTVNAPQRRGEELNVDSHTHTQLPGMTSAAAAPARAPMRSEEQELSAALKAIAERAQYITAASGAAIALKEGAELVCRAATGSTAPDLGACLEVKTGLTAECIRTGQTLRCDNAELDPRVDLESCRRLGIESIVVMPILRNSVLAGIFELFGSQAYCFQERDVETLKGLAATVASSLPEPPGPSTQSAKSVEGTPLAPEVADPAVVCNSCGEEIQAESAVCTQCATADPKVVHSAIIGGSSVHSVHWTAHLTVARVLVPAFFVTLAVLTAVAPIHPSATGLPPALLAQRSSRSEMPSPRAPSTATGKSIEASSQAPAGASSGSPASSGTDIAALQHSGMSASVKELLAGVGSDFSRLLPTSQADEEEFEITDEGNPNIRVWVDTRKGYYYCPADPLYGRTAKGTYMSQEDAESDYYIPALMKPCP